MLVVCVLVRRCSQRVRAVGVWKCAVAVFVEDVGARGAQCVRVFQCRVTASGRALCWCFCAGRRA